MATRTTKKQQSQPATKPGKSRRTRRQPRAQQPEEKVQKWTVNFRLLGITLGVIVVLVAGLFFLSQYQVQQQADSLLAVARQQEADREYTEALDTYRRYITLRPNDAAAFADFTELYIQEDRPLMAKIQRGNEAIAKLSNEPKNERDNPRIEGLQQLVAEMLYRVGEQTRSVARLKEAIARLEDIENKTGEPVKLVNTPVALRIAALCSLRIREIDQKQLSTEVLVDRLQAAHSANPADPQICLPLAQARFKGEGSQGTNPEQWKNSARSLMKTLTHEHKDDPFAWRARHMFLKEIGELPEATSAINMAIQLVEDQEEQKDPRRFLIWTTAGLFALEDNDTQKAREYLAKAIETAPPLEGIEEVKDQISLNEAYSKLAAIQYNDRDVDTAIATLEAAREKLKELGVQPEMLLVEFFTAEGRTAEAWKPLDRLKQRFGAGATLNTFSMHTRELDSIDSVLLRLEAALLQKEGKFHEAIEIWQRFALALNPAVLTEEIAVQKTTAHLNAAECYIVLQDYDSAEKQIAQANSILSNNSRIQYYFGMLDERRGLISSALSYYQQAVNHPPGQVFYPAREGYARVMLSLARASGQQPDWDAFEKEIPPAEKLPPAEQEKWAIFRAEAAMTQLDYDRSAAILKEARKELPASTRLLEALSLNAAAADNWEQAQGYAEDVKVLSEIRFHMLQYQLQARAGNLEGAEAELHEAIALAEGNDQVTLQRILAEFELTRLNKPAEGRARLAAIAENPSASSLIIYQRLVELAIAADEIDEAEQYLEKVEGLERPGDPTALYLQARIELRNGNVDVAQAKLEELRGMRTRWAPAKLLEALIAEAEDRPADAVLAYQDAVRFGDRNPAVANKIYDLLSDLQRYTDADEFLRKISAESRTIGLSTSLQQRDFGQAVTYAKAVVDEAPEDFRAWIRYGSALVFAEQMDEAEAAFNKAVELAPTSPHTLIQLVGFHISRFRVDADVAHLDAAKEALENFKRDADAKPETLAFLAAQCHQLLGQNDEADAQYRRALRINGRKDITIIRTAAPFLASRDRNFTVEILNDALKLDPDARDIIRLLVVLHSESGTVKDIQRAYDLLAAEADASDDQDDRKLLALIMLRTGDPDEQYQAGKLMEELIADSLNPPVVNLQLLAEIYEKTDRLDKALETMRRGIARGNTPIASVQYFVRLLIKAGQYEEAETSLAKMSEEKSVPLGFLIYAYAEIARSKGNPEKIDSLIADYVQPEIDKSQDSLQKSQMMLSAADLAESFDRHVAAENWHKQRLTHDAGTFATYSIWLAQQRRVRECVDLLLQHAKADNLRSMIGLLTTMTMLGAPEAEMARVNPLIEAAERKFDSEVDFLIALATLRQIQHQPREALGLYERALRNSNQSSITAKNNIALLLAEMEGRGDDALRYINDAINSTGTDNTSLLDTKAAVFMALGQYDDALALMQRIVLRVEGNPIYYLHLAECQLQTGDREAAARSFGNAEEKKIDNAVLTQPDAELLRKLRMELTMKTQEGA